MLKEKENMFLQKSKTLFQQRIEISQEDKEQRHEDKSKTIWSLGELHLVLQFGYILSSFCSLFLGMRSWLMKFPYDCLLLKYSPITQWNSRYWNMMEPKQKQYPVVDVTHDRSKVRCYKEQYCIGTWNVKSMNQGKLEVVKQEMARMNVNILGISELK